MHVKNIGIRGVAYALPAARASLGDLWRCGQLETRPALLAEYGFAHVCVAEQETPYDLALAATSALLEEQDISPATIDVLLYGGTPSVAFARAGAASDAARQISTASRFRYPATRLQYDLGLEVASTIAVDQLACTSLFAAVRLARALIVSGDARRVLCVSSEFFPGCAGRETIYNCTSDAACAVLVDDSTACNRIVASTQITKGCYWDGDAVRDEIVASYFPTARHVMLATLARADWSVDDIRWVIPHNVSTRSWDILLGLTGISPDRLWHQNVARLGHTLAGDNFINLRDAIDAGDVRSGDRLLLFAYGYGAHWTALAVEA